MLYSNCLHVGVSIIGQISAQAIMNATYFPETTENGSSTNTGELFFTGRVGVRQEKNTVQGGPYQL